MKNNYNGWFYKTHEYLQNAGKNGLIDYNDTKWVDMNHKYMKLAELESDLFEEQPFGVVANRRGFHKLLNLLEQSNYTFEDINDSLIDAYKHSLTNAMSRMLVNTHALMFKCSATDRAHVSADKFSDYYIIDAPFNQLHFGDRDEFIRQQLSKMHTTYNGKYIPMDEFVQSPYIDILGFCILCTVNGKICNDCQIAIDDKGFKFKMRWPYIYKGAEFVIYKLDSCKVIVTSGKYDDLVRTGKIDVYNGDASGQPCLVNLYDKRFAKATASAPNFGTLTKDALVIHNIQQQTTNDFSRQRTDEVTAVIYVLKYLREVPNLYPAVNYYDIVDTRRVMLESGENVIDGDKSGHVYSSSTDEINELEICTPPIVLDRSASTSFSTIVQCLSLRDRMVDNFSDIQKVGTRLISGNYMTQDDLNGLKSTMSRVKSKIDPCYKIFLEGALLTSLIDAERSEAFENFMTNLNNFIMYATIQNYTQYTDYNVFPQLYNREFIAFVDYVLKPFVDGKLENFSDIIKTTSNYFTMDNSRIFKRPVSEQCFIALKYDRESESWLFATPEIKHFKGIGNTFYINNDLNGDEIFKFFVLYTDTEDPAETEVDPNLNLETVFDFDHFYDEVEKHQGYIRYWNTENKIMKLSKTIYNKYDQTTAVQVLSKILKRKLSGEDIIDYYPSEMNYEPSNITSLNYQGYDEHTDEAPFAVNFLFYTIAMLNGNEDHLQAYFYRRLLERTHNNRYADMDIASAMDRSLMLPVNYSKVSVSPTRIDVGSSSIPIPAGVYAFYGIPFLTDNISSMFTQNPYRYTFNVYESEFHYPLIDENNTVEESYLAYANIESFNYMSLCYRHDVQIARLMTRYLIECYNAISYLQTDYRRPFNATEECDTFTNSITKTMHAISSYLSRYGDQFINPVTRQTCITLISDNFADKMYPIANTMASIRQINYNGRRKSIEEVSNEFLKVLQSVYKNTGFDDGVDKRVKKLYEHFKKINGLQSLYEFGKWVDEIDIEMIENLDNTRAENDNVVYGDGVFAMFIPAFTTYKQETPQKITTLKNLLEGLYSNNYEHHFKPIIEFCEDIIRNWIFDFYTMDHIVFDNSTTYAEKPYALTINVASGERFRPKSGAPVDTNATLIFEPIVEQVNGRWRIIEISKICEYAFFLGTDLPVVVNILAKSGQSIATLNGTMKFNRIGSSADDMDDFNQFPNMKNLCVDIQNVHEEFEINANDQIVNKKFGKMNYELLMGNSFKQLDHTSELILERKTMLPGSVDRVYAPGYILNKFANREWGNHASFEVYFKASQVLHIPITNDVLTSVGGKYFVGQTLYLATDDERTIFPVVVTAVDMSQNNGFVEARIDELKAKWFKVDDIEDIRKYLMRTITCTVIDDNICNFLDEYSNPDHRVYQIPEYPRSLDPSDEDNPDAYSMPGDPLYVESNAPYVYTRLNWIFNQDVPNRFMDEHPQDHHMIYVGSTSKLNDDPFKIKLINHEFEPFTDPEKYPLLRDEPDDHFVWAEERNVFQKAINKKVGEHQLVQDEIIRAWDGWAHVPTDKKTKDAYQKFLLNIEDLETRAGRVEADRKRYARYLQQLEWPTTWYNVHSYDAAMVYIDNGRAPIDLSRVTNIRNIPYTDKLKVYLYDWQNHMWIDPDTYSVDVEVLDYVQLGEWDNYKTNGVINSITITPEEDFGYSTDILIYFAYDQSDVFDDIPLNPKTCEVRFKPLLTLDSRTVEYDPYSRINLRKHFDGNEKYTFEEYSEIPNFSKEGYLVKRPNRSGKYTRSPSIRFCDMTVQDTALTYEDFDLYVKIPFDDVTTTDKNLTPRYSATILQSIDGFIDKPTTVKLICVSNNARSKYDGNVSTVMFEATAEIFEGNQILTVTNSTAPNYMTGNFICTVFKDSMYPHSGGLISVMISSDEHDVVDGNWVHVPDELAKYKIMPDEFVLVPKEAISGKFTLSFQTQYIKETDDTIDAHNANTYNPYEFYFNKEEDIRYPISDVRLSEHKERLVIDQTRNPDVKVEKTTYISVCRYSLEKIPKNGIIDMTGYLPTPLSRDHYEFWVNGHCFKGNDTRLRILSPTSIQLTDLKSLRNFECVELVDDTEDSIISTKGSVYIDINGNTYASYKLAVKSGESMCGQDIRYSFNANNQQPMHTYTSSIISNPNNRNIEKDILTTLDLDEVFNVPSINGVDIYDPYSYHLGLIETPNEKILELFDQVWRREQCTNPIFPTTHNHDLELIEGDKIILHTKYSGEDGKYILYATGVCDHFFTLYISKSSEARIDDTVNTIKILPFIRTGVFVYVDTSVQGRWLHSTHPNVKPIKIM